jgi:uncharacterized protein
MAARCTRLGLLRVIPLLFMALFFAAPAAANPMEEARRAASRGDYATAIKLWLPLAEAGNIDAQMELGSLYSWGARDFAKNEAEGFKWWLKAAEKGNPHAQLRIGYGYEIGRGVARDYAAAARWYRKAADDHDDRDAQHSLGGLYARGLGVAQDYAEAAKWYRRSAAQWLWEAKFDLGELYAAGKGVPRDLVQAYMWFTLAAGSAGTEEDRQSKIRHAREAVAKQMSAGDIRKAEYLAARFPPYSGPSR